MIKKERDKFLLSTGKEIDVAFGIFGLDEPEEGEDWSISEGYDGTVWTYPWDAELVYNQYDLTKEEVSEIADYMINLWTRFKKEVG